MGSKQKSKNVHENQMYLVICSLDYRQIISLMPYKLDVDTYTGTIWPSQMLWMQQLLSTCDTYRAERKTCQAAFPLMATRCSEKSASQSSTTTGDKCLPSGGRLLLSSLQVSNDDDRTRCLPWQQSSENEGGEEEEEDQSLHCCTWNPHRHKRNIRNTITSCCKARPQL